MRFSILEVASDLILSRIPIYFGYVLSHSQEMCMLLWLETTSSDMGVYHTRCRHELFGGIIYEIAMYIISNKILSGMFP